MIFDVCDGVWVAKFQAPRNPDVSVYDISDISVLPFEEALKFLDLVARYSVGKSFGSKAAFLGRVVKPFGKYLEFGYLLPDKKTVNLPTNYSDWQILIFNFGLWYIARSDSGEVALETLCTQWRAVVCPFLTFLQEEGYLPLGLIWDDMRLPKEQVSFRSPLRPRLLGETPAISLADESKIEKAPIDKTLAGPLFWDTDAQYLDAFESRLRHCDKLLANCLDDYWTRLVRDYRTGKSFLRQVTELDWLEHESHDKWSFPRGKQPLPITTWKNPLGHCWALRLFKHSLTFSNSISCLTELSLQKHPSTTLTFMRDHTAEGGSLANASALLPSQYGFFTPRHIFNRYIGILNHSDLSVALAILIREHPNLNPESLAGAKLANNAGKSYLIVTDDASRQIFSVDKPRAGSRKYAPLTHKASQVMRHLIRVTAPVRALMRRAGSAYWRYLFLGCVGQGSLGHPADSKTFMLHHKTGASLTNLYPQLPANGIAKGTLTFAKIRNTQGVLAWFDTGSVQHVAKRMGNSVRVVIEHYIPESLIAAWNERLIRRFQNTLIILASHNEDWCLDVIDIPTFEELNHFLAQLVVDMPFGSSPVADKIHEFFGSRFGINVGEAPNPSNLGYQLQIRLSPRSLALLLAYRQWSLAKLTMVQQALPDSETGIPPKHFIELAGMIQCIGENSTMGDKLRESLDAARLQRCYRDAINYVPEMLKKFSHFSIQPVFDEVNI